MSKAIQTSLIPISEGAARQVNRGQLWACPNGHGKPPYLIYPFEGKPDFQGDTKWAYLFQDKETGRVGILKYPGMGLYWLDSPTSLSPRHKFDNAITARESFNGWQEVCERLMLVTEDQARTFALTGDESEQLNDVNSIL